MWAHSRAVLVLSWRISGSLTSLTVKCSHNPVEGGRRGGREEHKPAECMVACAYVRVMNKLPPFSLHHHPSVTLSSFLLFLLPLLLTPFPLTAFLSPSPSLLPLFLFFLALPSPHPRSPSLPSWPLLFSPPPFSHSFLSLSPSLPSFLSLPSSPPLSFLFLSSPLQSTLVSAPKDNGKVEREGGIYRCPFENNAKCQNVTAFQTRTSK